MKITERLEAEHRLLRVLFGHLEQLLPRLRALGEFRAFAVLTEGLLRAHARLEEEYLFAPLDHFLANTDQLEVLFRDHHEIDDRFGQVQLAPGVPQARRLLEGALAFSRRHFSEEETRLFALAERVIGPDALEELGRAAGREAETGQSADVAGVI